MLIDVDDVSYFQANDKYTSVFTAEGEALIRTPLKELAPELDAARFWQVHRGTIVNVAAHRRPPRATSPGRVALRMKTRPEARCGVARLRAPVQADVASCTRGRICVRRGRSRDNRAHALRTRATSHGPTTVTTTTRATAHAPGAAHAHDTGFADVTRSAWLALVFTRGFGIAEFGCRLVVGLARAALGRRPHGHRRRARSALALFAQCRRAAAAFETRLVRLRPRRGARGAFVNALAMLALVVFIVVEAVHRLLEPAPVAGASW